MSPSNKVVPVDNQYQPYDDQPSDDRPSDVHSELEIAIDVLTLKAAVAVTFASLGCYQVVADYQLANGIPQRKQAVGQYSTAVWVLEADKIVGLGGA